MNILSRAVGRLRPSATSAITDRARALKAAGRDIIALSAGEPDFATPAHVLEAAAEAMSAGRTRYTPVAGIPELRAAVRRKFARENGIDYADDEVMVACGGKQVIANAMLATLDPGDEVVIPAPYWVSYPELVTFCGGQPIVVPTDPGDGFLLDPGALEAALTPRTKWLILNSPGNPSGAVLGRARLEAIAEVVRRHPRLHVLSDDIYEHLVYGEAGFATLAAVAPDLRERVLIVNGVSKTYAMTGWRIGYGAGPAALIAAMLKVQSQTTTCAASVAQWAALAALEGPQALLAERRERFRQRRDLVVARLAAAGLSCPRPDGAFYVFPGCGELIGRRTRSGAFLGDDAAFAAALLDEAGVALVPGSAFGLRGHLRVSYAAAEADLEEACARIGDFCARLERA